MPNSYETGDEGERLVKSHLERRGVSAEIQPRDGVNDIHTSRYIIEVKTAHRTRYRKERPMAWQFLLRKAGHAEVGYADFIVLCCLDDDNHFYVIPTSALSSRTKLTIPSKNYKGRYAKYLDAWGQINA